MTIVSIVILIFITVVLFYNILLHSKDDFLKRYVTFILIVSFYLVIIIQLKSVLWISLVCAVGLIFNSSFTLTKKILLLVVAILFISFYRVPGLPSDFKDYLQNEHGLYCESVECLQVLDGDEPNLQAEITKIHDFDFNQNIFWAMGEIATETQEIKAINIMGFWFTAK